MPFAAIRAGLREPICSAIFFQFLPCSSRPSINFLFSRAVHAVFRVDVVESALLSSSVESGEAAEIVEVVSWLENG